MIERRLIPDCRDFRALATCAALRGALVAAVLVLGAQTCEAGLVMSLSTSSDLNSLTPGQVVRVDVALSGLNAGDQLNFLASTITFDGDLLGTPTITSGPIVPDPTGFTPGESMGVADALYDTLFAFSGLPITTNGIFYSFDVTVVRAGAVMIAFDFVDSIGSDAVGAPLSAVTAGGPLQSIAGVPEPPSWLLGALGLGGVVGFRAVRTGGRRLTKCFGMI